LITIWLVPVITAQSYVPFFVMGAILVPLAVLSIWVLGGRIGPVAEK
jgi:ACS family hexuronate transporter-like MFS transporter